MSEQGKSVQRGRLLLFEAGAAKRHYYKKYVVGDIWRGLTESEKEQRIRDVLRARQDGTSFQRPADRRNGPKPS